MVLKSFSKINLSLNINSKLKNGLHDIQSYYCLINLFDKIKIRKIDKKKDKVVFFGPFVKHIKKSNNSITNLLKLLRKLELISGYYSVNVIKNIPVFSGLGGGTSNAASVLKFLLKGKVSKNILEKVEKLIGSDLRLFFHKQGFLQNLRTIKTIKKQKLFFLLSRPNIICSTKKIYSKVKKFTKAKFYSISNNLFSVKFLKKMKNDLEKIALNEHPKLRILKNFLENLSNIEFVRMTGSGSAIIAYFSSAKKCKEAEKKVKKQFRNYWCKTSKTI